MELDYEYRLGGRSRSSWLAAIALVGLIVFTAENQSSSIFITTVGLCAILIIWLLTRNEIAGIRVDHQYLTLAAWRDPKAVPLSDIAYLRMADWTDDSALTLVYKNGDEEEIPSGDLPSIQLLSEILADRGVLIKDPAA
jgi:hypothetical protein